MISSLWIGVEVAVIRLADPSIASVKDVPEFLGELPDAEFPVTVNAVMYQVLNGYI